MYTMCKEMKTVAEKYCSRQQVCSIQSFIFICAMSFVLHVQTTKITKNAIAVLLVGEYGPLSTNFVANWYC